MEFLICVHIKESFRLTLKQWVSLSEISLKCLTKTTHALNVETLVTRQLKRPSPNTTIIPVSTVLVVIPLKMPVAISSQVQQS